MTDTQYRLDHGTNSDVGTQGTITRGFRAGAAWFARVVTDYWHSHSHFLIIAALYLAGIQWVSRIYGFPINLSLYKYIVLFSAILAFFLLIALVAYVLLRYWSAHPLRMLKQKFFTDWRLPKRVVYVLLALAVASLVMSSYSSTKTAIRVFMPFYFDDPAIYIDNLIFGGGDAWKVLQPILGYPLVTYLLSVGYHLWAFVTSGVFLGAALMLGRKKLRAQYLVAFLLCWVLVGNVLAILLSSVGPAFYEAIHGGDRFVALMDYLNAVNAQHSISALWAQDLLLGYYQDGVLGVGSGISAAPSMHVCIAMLITIFAFKLDRRLGYAAVVYLAMIFIGSIHLGWHYAIDGILSILVTPLVWFLAGRIVEWRPLASGKSRLNQPD